MPVAFAGFQCLDPKLLRDASQWAFIPTAHWYGKANRFTTRAGRKPGSGAFLLDAADSIKLQILGYGTDYDAVFWSDVPGGEKTTLKKLVVTGFTCVVPGAGNELNRPFLVEVADVRWHLERLSIDRAFNVSNTDGTAYLTQTLNAGSPWTWAQLVQHLWTACGLTGTATLPFTPNGTPENLSYYAGSAWGALCDVLDRIACVADYDPEAANPLSGFTIRRIGSDTSEAAAVTALAGADKDWDGTPADPNRAWMPEKIRVTFTRAPAPTDGSTPYYSVDVNTTVTGVYAGSVVRLFDDLTAIGATGSPTNAAALATRASERAADWRRKRATRDQRVQRTYTDVRRTALRPVGSYWQTATMTDTGDGLHTEVTSGRDDLLERWRPGGPQPAASVPPTPLTTLNTDGTHILVPTTLIAADNLTGISFDSTYAGPADTRLFNYPVTVLNWGVLNTDTVFPQEWIGNKGARDTSNASSFPGFVGWQVYSQIWNGNAGSLKAGAKAALNTGRSPLPTGAGDLTKSQGLLQLVNWGGLGSGSGYVCSVFSGPTNCGVVFGTVTSGNEPTPPDETGFTNPTGGVPNYYVNTGWRLQVGSQYVFTAFGGGGTGPGVGITYYDSGVAASVAGTFGAAKHNNTGGGSGRWADTTILPVLSANGHIVLGGAAALNLRFGVERTGGDRMGGDAIINVLTSTTQTFRVYFYGGLYHWHEVVGTSPPPPPPPGTGQLVVTVVDKAGNPLAGRSVTTTHGAGTTNASGQVVFTGIAPGAGTSTVTLLGGESCRSSASWPGGSNLSNFNSIPYEVIAASTTEVVHQILDGAAAFNADTGDLSVLVGDVDVITNVAVRTPATVVAIIPSTQNDYALAADYAGRTVYLSSTGGASVITGFDATGVQDGARVRVLLDSASGNITVNHADAGSAAANRVLIHTGANKTYSADGGFEMEYDASASRWRIPY